MKQMMMVILLAGNVSLSIAEEGWKPLFDGTSFTGWTFEMKDDAAPEAIWTISNGTIVVNGQGNPPGVLRTEKTYTDYELQFDWRFPGKPGNSGCLVHTSTSKEISIWPKSIEVQLMSENAGDFWLIGESIAVPEKQIASSKKGKPSRRRLNLTDGSEKPAGEWNTMRILARDSKIEVYVNDELVNKGWNCSVNAGAICLQAEKADIQFRNILIKE
jgi:hypothetical protein